MIFRQKKIKKKRKKIYQVLKIIIFLVDFVPQSQHPSHIIPNYMCHPERKMSSQTLNVIPNLLRDLLIVPQNRSFQASLSGHPPRRRKLLLRWTASQALQSLPLHKKFYTCRKYKEKLHQTSKLNQRAFAQNRKPIFFLCFEPRRSRLKIVLCLCQKFSYTIKMCSPKTPSRFRKVIQLK